LLSAQRQAATVWAFSGIMIANGRPINNRPQVANLPHKIVAARDETNG